MYLMSSQFNLQLESLYQYLGNPKDHHDPVRIVNQSGTVRTANWPVVTVHTI